MTNSEFIPAGRELPKYGRRSAPETLSPPQTAIGRLSDPILPSHFLAPDFLDSPEERIFGFAELGRRRGTVPLDFKPLNLSPSLEFLDGPPDAFGAPSLALPPLNPHPPRSLSNSRPSSPPAIRSLGGILSPPRSPERRPVPSERDAGNPFLTPLPSAAWRERPPLVAALRARLEGELAGAGLPPREPPGPPPRDQPGTARPASLLRTPTFPPLPAAALAHPPPSRLQPGPSPRRAEYRGVRSEGPSPEPPAFVRSLPAAASRPSSPPRRLASLPFLPQRPPLPPPPPSHRAHESAGEETPRERTSPAASRGPSRSASPSQAAPRRAAWDEVRVLRPIGTGATAEVFEAEWRGQRVAAKRFTWRCEEFTPQEVDRFRGEAAVLERLRHPGLPRLLALGDRPPHLFLLTDLCPGGTLADALRRGRFEPREAAAVGAAVARALAYLHGLEPRVCHRDVKPENVLLGPDGEWRLVDFGSAVELQAEADGSGRSVRRVLGCEGTPYYIAPEVVRDEPADERVDLYALGMLLYELATGRKPASHAGPAALDPHAVAEGRRPPLQPLEEAGELAGLVRQLWADDPEARPSAQRAARALEALARPL